MAEYFFTCCKWSKLDSTITCIFHLIWVKILQTVGFSAEGESPMTYFDAKRTLNPSSLLGLDVSRSRLDVGCPAPCSGSEHPCPPTAHSWWACDQSEAHTPDPPRRARGRTQPPSPGPPPPWRSGPDGGCAQMLTPWNSAQATHRKNFKTRKHNFFFTIHYAISEQSRILPYKNLNFKLRLI